MLGAEGARRTPLAGPTAGAYDKLILLTAYSPILSSFPLRLSFTPQPATD
jgi:hypothetical protein